MKVKCQLCGTKFDLELNHNICPECAVYYRLDGVSGAHEDSSTHTELRDMYDSNSNNTIYNEEKYDHSEIHSMYNQGSVHTMYSNNENCGATFGEKLDLGSKPRKSINKVKVAIIAVEILAIIFCLLLPFMGMHTSKKKLEAQRITESSTVVPKFIGDKIQVGAYSIQVKDYYIDNSAYWNLPENYVVYAVSYKTQHEGTEYTSLYNSAQVYLETKDGIDISPLESYEAKKLMTQDRYEVVGNKVASYIKNDGGILYFVLKKDAKNYALCFNVFKCDQDDGYYKEMDTIYVMYLPELEVE
ncbi:MAG: hypothetical protein IJO70_07850 [Lachnospiraceae bacterium]|nr:hypothetical protein [Lachnospiraceae bacterium]